MLKRIAITAALGSLAGCAVPMQTVDASRAACASYGFQPDSDAFVNCVMMEQQWAMPPLPQQRTQFCFGSGAFEHCQ